MKTVVLQSYRSYDIPAWIERCMASVRLWALDNGWQYELLDDSLFAFAPEWARLRCCGNLYAVTDICRLEWLRNRLDNGYERAIWVDADVLVFAPELLDVTTRNGYAFARELFLHVGIGGRITQIEGVNNSLMVFERNQAMLDMYYDACLGRLRHIPPGPVPRTALGPALLTSMAHESPLDTMNGVGQFSVSIMRQIAAGGGYLTSMCEQLPPGPLGAANLCHFLRDATSPHERSAFDAFYGRVVDRLLATGGEVLSQWGDREKNRVIQEELAVY